MSRGTFWTFLLAWVGGFVDAVGFLALFHLFTAHMSGNSIWLGTYLGVGNWRLGLHHLFPIPVFVLGVAIGTVAVELARRRRMRAPFVPALLLEAALLALFMLCGSAFIVDGSVRTETVWAFYLLAALPALAMGVQNATLRRVAGQTLHTTYITGVLNGLAEESVHVLFWLREQTRAAGLRAPPCAPRRRSPRCAPPSPRRCSGSPTLPGRSAAALPSTAGSSTRWPCRWPSWRPPSLPSPCGQEDKVAGPPTTRCVAAIDRVGTPDVLPSRWASPCSQCG